MSGISYKQNRTAKQSLRLILISLALGVAFTTAFGSQLYGWLLGHHSNIGAPLFVLSESESSLIFYLVAGLIVAAFGLLARSKFQPAGMMMLLAGFAASFLFEWFYHPMNLLIWLYSYWELPAMAQTHQTWLIFSGLYFFYIQLCFGLIFKRKEIFASGNFGTAIWGSGEKLIQDNGLILGRDMHTGKILRYNEDRHLTTMAMTGSGKGTGSIIPNLLTYPGSIIIVDPKGENCNITLERREDMGQDVYVLDPFFVSNYSKYQGVHSFNPMDLIDPNDPNAKEDCNFIRDIIMTKNPEKSDFWFDAARQMFSGLIYYIAKAPEFNDRNHPDFNPDLRSLTTINDLLSLRNDDFMAYMEKISRSNLSLDVKKAANKILNDSDSKKMLASVIKTMEVNIEFLDMPSIRQSINKSSFDLDKILTGDHATVYIIIPQDKIETYGKWLTMIITMIVNRTIKVRDPAKANFQNDKILFCLDEFANLGILERVKTGYTLLRGYGMTFWIFLQDLPQFQKAYKDWETFVSNSGIFQTFNTNDSTTAEYISKRIGDTTIFTTSNSENQRAGHLGISDDSGTGRSVSERGRRLIMPNEVSTLDEDTEILIPNQQDPIKAKKIAFYKDPYFKGLFKTREEVQRLALNAPEPPLPDINSNIEHDLKAIIYGHRESFKEAPASLPADQQEGGKAEKEQTPETEQAQTEPSGMAMPDWDDEENDIDDELFG